MECTWLAPGHSHGRWPFTCGALPDAPHEDVLQLWTVSQLKSREELDGDREEHPVFKGWVAVDSFPCGTRVLAQTIQLCRGIRPASMGTGPQGVASAGRREPKADYPGLYTVSVCEQDMLGLEILATHRHNIGACASGLL